MEKTTTPTRPKKVIRKMPNTKEKAIEALSLYQIEKVE